MVQGLIWMNLVLVKLHLHPTAPRSHLSITPYTYTYSPTSCCGASCRVFRRICSHFPSPESLHTYTHSIRICNISRSSKTYNVRRSTRTNNRIYINTHIEPFVCVETLEYDGEGLWRRRAPLRVWCDKRRQEEFFFERKCESAKGGDRRRTRFVTTQFGQMSLKVIMTYFHQIEITNVLNYGGRILKIHIGRCLNN